MAIAHRDKNKQKQNEYGNGEESETLHMPSFFPLRMLGGVHQYRTDVQIDYGNEKKKAKRESECNKMQLFCLQLANCDHHWMNSNRSARKIVRQITQLTLKLYIFFCSPKISTDFSYLKFNLDFCYNSLKL